MTRIYKKDVFDTEHYAIDCQVFDKKRLVFVFRALVRRFDIVETHAVRCREGYSLMSEQRLFNSRLCSLVDGSTTVEQLTNLSCSYYDELPF